MLLPAGGGRTVVMGHLPARGSGELMLQLAISAIVGRKNKAKNGEKEGAAIF